MRRLSPTRIIWASLIALLLVGLWWLRGSRRTPDGVPALARKPLSLSATRADSVERDGWPSEGPSPIHLNRGATEQDASSQAGSFQGRVLASHTGRGIPDAELTFEFSRGASSVRTGADGAFQFVPSEPGVHRLASITANGFLPFAPEWGRSRIVFTARPGERIRDVVLLLSPAVEYLGIVLDPENKPVPGAQVKLLNAGEGETALVPLPDTFTSNAQGEFRFQAPQGAWLEAAHPNFSPGRAYVNQYVQATHRLTLRLSEKADAAPREAIAGQVLDPQGVPIFGAAVSASRRGQWRRGDRFYPQARTDPDGKFELTGLAPGTYAVQANYTGYAPAQAHGVETGERNLTLLLSAGGRLYGTVRDGRTRTPVAAFTVTVQRTFGPLRREAFTALAFMDGEGRYEVSGIPPGSFAAVAAGYGYSPSREVTFTTEDGSEKAIDFFLDRGAELFGRVMDATSHAPIASAQVSLEGQLDAASAISLLSSTVTDSAGRFELSGMAAGLGSVLVEAEGHHSRIVSGLNFETGRRMGPLDLELRPTAPGEEPTTELEGIGATLMPRNDVLVITQLLPGAGAALAGLRSGDEILSIDGLNVVDLGFYGSVQRIRGPEGSCFPLTVRKDGGSVTTVTVCRRRIRG